MTYGIALALCALLLTIIVMFGAAKKLGKAFKWFACGALPIIVLAVPVLWVIQP